MSNEKGSCQHECPPLSRDSRVFCFVFFSSRRRHARYWRDWSSDVCSSDLLSGQMRGQVFHSATDTYQTIDLMDDQLVADLIEKVRSEERRVGKECRSRC